MNTLKIALFLIAVGVIGLIVVNFYSPSDTAYSTSGFKSNGERIYFTATSNSGKTMISSIGTMNMGRTISCASCHGADGKGGRGRMMMWTFDAPDIRYSVLTAVNDSETPYT